MLNEQQRNTLHLICETLVSQTPPDGRDTNGNSSQKLGETEGAIAENHASRYRVVNAIERRLITLSQRERRDFVRVLNGLERPLACKILTGNWRPFSKLAHLERERALRNLANSRNPGLRRFFQAIKRVTLFLCYAAHPQDLIEPNGHENPTWSEIGYQGTNDQRASHANLPVLLLKNAQRLSCDFLVIGSGAGGSVAACNLASAGKDVLVVEKGEYCDGVALGTSEFDGNRKLFEKFGSFSSRDLGTIILSGSTVGGGTTVNWMSCLELPADIRQHWEYEFGLPLHAGSQFGECISDVRLKLSVNSEHSYHNRQNQLLLDGARSLAYKTELIERNAVGCGDCGFCGYGCRSGAKQDARRTYLKDAVDRGARIVANCEVVQLVTRDKNVKFARAITKGSYGEYPIEIDCNAVVLAGGAIQSAAILLRSGFTNPNIGRYLHLHPTTAIASRFPDPVRAWRGAPQTVVCTEFSNLDRRGYGCRLEVAPMHPGFGAMALAWESSRQHKDLMRHFANLANIIIITRDRNSGRVTHKNNRTSVDYRLSRFDSQHLMRGVHGACEIHRAAEADLILGPHQTPIIFRPGDDFGRFLETITRAGTASNRISLFSAHQMSTCRIARTPADGVFDPTGRSFDYQNLYVADASAFPTSVGVNPMLTVMGLSHFLSKNWT